MPRNDIAYDGPIDLVGSITQIAEEIIRLVCSTRRPGPLSLKAAPLTMLGTLGICALCDTI